MNEIDNSLFESNLCICENIDTVDKIPYTLVYKNILNELRNFVEMVAVKLYYDENHNIKSGLNQEIIKNAFNYSKKHYPTIDKLHSFLQISKSHFSSSDISADFLIQRYLDYLFSIKKLFKEKYNIELLSNIEKIIPPITKEASNYYLEIYKSYNSFIPQNIIQLNGRYYVRKIKPIFLKGIVLYEITLSIANEFDSKFDRIVAFSDKRISTNYAIKIEGFNLPINVFNRIIDVVFITNWSIAIRNCELINIGRIFGLTYKNVTSSKIYFRLMDYFKQYDSSLNYLLDLAEIEYNDVKKHIIGTEADNPIFTIIEEARKVCNDEFVGNTIRYLLFNLKNKIIRKQLAKKEEQKIGNYCLDKGCIAFSKAPFYMALIEHVPKLMDLFECIKFEGHEHELLARNLKNLTENEGKIYNEVESLGTLEYVTDTSTKYNLSLYYKHLNNRIVIENGYAFIQKYEDEIVYIIRKLLEKSNINNSDYGKRALNWIINNEEIDSEEKKKKILKLFERTNVSLLYGSAGTGKTTMINYVANIFDNYKKLILANTNSALENLRQRVKCNNVIFKTVASFLYDSRIAKNYDLIIIDECSTISNNSLFELLNAVVYNKILFVGDIFQIESIKIGNWFSLINYFLPKYCYNELSEERRTKNQNLIELWKLVRCFDEKSMDLITSMNYLRKFDESFFEHYDDEIILCLNYDGPYGINNINRVMQINNPSRSFYWNSKYYKINDPILFNESKRFYPEIYNNLKGKILDINVKDKYITFTVEIYKALDKTQVDFSDLIIVEEKDDRTVISFNVFSEKDDDEENDDLSSKTIVPFEVSYAISIHKAQGLEFENVKIVLTDEVEESITINIFYTSITRSKNNLYLYSSRDTMKALSKKFIKDKSFMRDVNYIANKFKLKIYK